MNHFKKYALLILLTFLIPVYCNDDPSSMDLLEGAKKKNLQQLKAAIFQGANVNISDELGQTPLYYEILTLAELTHKKAVLLNKMAEIPDDLFEKGKEFSKTLHKKEMKKEKSSNNAPDRKLNEVEYKKLQKKFKIRKRKLLAEINEIKKEIHTHQEIIKVMLDQKANVHARAKNGKTPLTLALEKKLQIADLLKQYGIVN